MGAEHYSYLVKALNGYAGAVGACERIMGTPLPYV